MAAALRTESLRKMRWPIRYTRRHCATRFLDAGIVRRSASTLAVLEQCDGKLMTSSLASIAAANELGSSTHAFIAGTKAREAATTASRIPGIEKIIFVDNKAYEKTLPETFAPLLVENIKKGGYTHVFANHSASGKNVLPRVAALLDVQQVSDITKVKSKDTFVRPIYAGNAILTVRCLDDTKVVTVRSTAFPPTPTEGGSAVLEEGVDPNIESCTYWLSEELTESPHPELATAERIVAGGRGLKSSEDFDRMLHPLADALGAAVGASRAAVDAGFADNSLQIGQTGKNVAPQLYLCAGISGAIQHLAGMKDSKIIAAINKDPDAPIFQVADVGLLGDLFEHIPDLTKRVKTA